MSASIAALFGHVPSMIMLTGVLVALCGAVLGTFLVLRGSALLTDAISHAVLFGIVMVWLATGQRSGPLVVAGAAAAGLLTVVLSETLAASKLVRADAAIGLVFPALFATAVLLIGLYGRDIHIDVHAVLLGEIGFVWLNVVPVLGVDMPVAVLTLGAVLAVNALFVGLFWKELKLAVFDPALAAAFGLLPGLLFHGLLALTSVTAVAAFDAVGVILFIAFVIIPPSAARLLTHRLGTMLVLAMLIGVASSLAGYGFAVLFDVSIAAMMAVCAGAIFLVVLVVAPGEGLLAAQANGRRIRAERDMATLCAHLFMHQATPQAGEENSRAALVSHFGWTPRRAEAATAQAGRAGLIVTAADGRLMLTEDGIRKARLVLPSAAAAAALTVAVDPQANHNSANPNSAKPNSAKPNAAAATTTGQEPA